MATLRKSGEEYLETILILKRDKGVVHSVDIAHYMDYSKPSVSRAVGNLRREGYLEMAKNGELSLTPSGQLKAEQILERHRVLTDMFTALGVPADVAAADACEVEHVISDVGFGCIKAYLASGTLPAPASSPTPAAPLADDDKKDDKKKKKKKKKG